VLIPNLFEGGESKNIYPAVMKKKQQCWGAVLPDGKGEEVLNRRGRCKECRGGKLHSPL